MPQIIIVSLPLVDETVQGVKDKYLGGEKKLKQLARLFEEIANKYESKFVDIAKLV